MSTVIRRPSASRDLVSIFRHYAREAGLRVADRFLVQTEATFSRLAGMPGMGARYDPVEAIHGETRVFPVDGFRKYLGF